MTRLARRSRAGHPSPAPPSPPGGFSVHARKTIAAAAADIFAAWIETPRRARWLAGVPLTIGRTSAPASLRVTCDEDDTDIEVRITPAGRGKCAVSVAHTRLANAQVVTERRHCWKEMLAALKHYVEGAG
jgi:hypothetical protein